MFETICITFGVVMGIVLAIGGTFLAYCLFTTPSPQGWGHVLFGNRGK